MTTQDVAEGVTAWILEATGISSGYHYMPSQKDANLPDVVVEVIERRMTREDPEFPFSAIQQRWVRLFVVGASIMVDNSDPESAADTLYGYSDVMEAALMADGTLGGRVPFVSPYFAFDFSAPFVEYHDGTRGREMNMQMSVGELVEAPE